MVGSFKAELIKLYKRPAIWVLALVTIVSTLFWLLIYWIIKITPQEAQTTQGNVVFTQMISPENVLGLALTSISGFGGAVALILGAMTVGGEYGWNTWKTVLTQKPTRSQVFFGKLLGTASVVALYTLISIATAYLDSLVVMQIEGIKANWPSIAELIRAIGAGLLIMGAWTSIGIFLATLFKGTALAVGLGLIYSLALETIMQLVAQSVSQIREFVKILIGINASQVSSTFGQQLADNSVPGSVLSVSTDRAVITLILYVVILGGLSVILFRRQEQT